MEVKLSDLKDIYENEIRKNVRNKRKLFNFERNKMSYYIDIKRVLEEGSYDGGKYNIFLIYHPKTRVIMSQNVYDKVINHYVTRFILMPKLEKYLSDRNCATRKDMGMTYAVKLMKKDIEYFKRKYETFYYIKLDISKYFYNIDQEVLLKIMEKDLDEEEYALVKSIIVSTNRPYINRHIKALSKKIGQDLPLYNEGKGLPIGNMTSQFLAVFYLSRLHHYIRHNLHLRFIAYMDDYIILHEDKEYLKKCLEEIKQKLHDEYKLEVNEKKTYIANIKKGIPFIGYIFSIDDRMRTRIRLTKSSRQNIKKGIKRNIYLYETGQISFSQLFCSIENYKNSHKFLNVKQVDNLIDRYWKT